MATYPGPINTRQDFATAVLTELGVPVSANNVTNMLTWMAAENPPNDWAPRNNPLNNGLGASAAGGLGSYPNLAVAAQDVAKNLAAGNYGYSGIVQALQNNADSTQFVQAVVNSDWSQDHYKGTEFAAGDVASGDPNATAPTSSTPATTNTSSTTTTTGTSPANTPDSTDIDGMSFTGTEQETDALSTIEGDLQAYGFTPAQTKQLTNWAWGEITNNVDPTQIAIDLQSQPAFLQQFPGFQKANEQLVAQGLPALSVSQYQQYQTQAMAMAQAAGLPPGFINKNNIGFFVGNNVSTSELSARMNDATTLAINSTAEQRAMFNQYFGVTDENGYLGANQNGHGGLTNGQIAAIALDPMTAEPLIHQQIIAAQIGGSSVTSGVGAIQKGTAVELAQAGITSAQATSAFQNDAQYASLEKARPGMGGEAKQGTVTADQIATGALLGNPGAQRQLQTAVEVAKSPFTGGGGYIQNTKGTGVGSASSTGAGQ